MAVPTILAGIASTTEIVAIPGLNPYVNTEKGDPMHDFLEKCATLDRIYFVHPLKISQIDGNEQGKKFCDIIIQVMNE